MDFLVTPIGASPVVRTKTDGPTRIERHLESARSDQTTGSSSALPAPGIEPVTAPKIVAAPGGRERVADNNKEPPKQDLPKDNPSSLPTIERFVFEHDELSGMSVVKLMDSKGNVIMQVPPEFYLRSIQILMEYGGVDLQASSGGTENSKLTGLLISKKV